MKNAFVWVALAVFMAAACKPMDEKRKIIKAEIGGFERDWAATNDIVNNWGLELKLQLEADSSIAQHCPKLEEDYNKELTQWNNAAADFERWKADFDKGLIETVDATQNLKEFKTVLEQYNQKAEDWATALQQCKQNNN